MSGHPNTVDQVVPAYADHPERPLAGARCSMPAGFGLPDHPVGCVPPTDLFSRLITRHQSARGQHSATASKKEESCSCRPCRPIAADLDASPG